MSNPEQAMTTPIQSFGSNSQQLSNHEPGYYAGNMQLSEPNPNNQQNFSSTNQGGPSAPRQPAFAPSAAINEDHGRGGSVTSQQTNSSQSSPNMPSPDSVAHHSVQTSPTFGHGNFPYGPGYVRSEVNRIEGRLGNSSAPQHMMPQIYNMVPEVGFNSMVNNQCAPGLSANWMEEAPIELGPNDECGKISKATETCQNVHPTNRKRDFVNYDSDHEQFKMPRSSQMPIVNFDGPSVASWKGNVGDAYGPTSSQMHQADFERAAQNLGTPGASWQGGYNNQDYAHGSCQIPEANFEKPAQKLGIPGASWQENYNNQDYQVQEHGNFNNHLPGAAPQFGEYNDDPMQYKSQGDTYGSASSQMHEPNFEKPAQNGGTAGVPWQGNHNNQVHEHDTSKNHNISPLSATIARDVSFERANQTGPQDQVLTGNFPQNLQKEIHQDTNNSAGNNFNSNQTTSGQITQWIPNNNDNLGLMELDWVYPEGVCNFETYSNHIGIINPWKEIQAERAQAPSSSAPDTPQMGNNEGESSSQEARADKIRLASRKTDDPNLTTEEQDKKAAERKASRGYTKTYKQKTELTRESYKNEAELLPKKISRPREYRANLEKNIVFAGKALEKWHPRLLGHETRAYLAGMKKLREKFDDKSLDLELTKAREKHAAQNQKFLEAAQEYKQGKSKTEKSSAASRQSRAKSEAKHWENVCNVSSLQWTLRMETKLAELATLYVQRTMPTVISKLNPILKDVEEQCKKDKKVQEYKDFKEFLKEHRHLFMVQRKSLPSGSTGFMRMYH